MNKAVNHLRDALGDSAEQPRFVETLPRKGYRFIAPVTCSGEELEAAAVPADAPDRPRTRRWLPLLVVLAAGIEHFKNVRRVRVPRRHDDWTAQAIFDCETIVPHVDVPVRGGMTQLMVMPRSGDRLIFGLFQAGQVGMLDVSDPEHPVQAGIVNLGKDAGPHMLALTDDDKRLVVSGYFLNEDGFGKIHFEGDHHVHVIKVFKSAWLWTGASTWISTPRSRQGPRGRTASR